MRGCWDGIAGARGLRPIALQVRRLCAEPWHLAWFDARSQQQSRSCVAVLEGGELGAKSNGAERDQTIRSAVLSAITDHEPLRALQYTSSNTWIIEQTRVGAALGNLRRSSQVSAVKDDVAQGGELLGSYRQRGATAVEEQYFQQPRRRVLPRRPEVSGENHSCAACTASG